MPAWTIKQDSVSSEYMDGEVVAIHLGTGIYYSLRGSAAVLWRALDAPRSGTSLAGLLAENYDVSGDVAGRDVEEFLQRLLAEQLVLQTEAPPAALAPQPVGERTAYAAPQLERYSDLQDLLLLDPIHDTGTQGWPHLPPPENKG